MHKIDGLHIRPGITVTLHQKYPAYVIECEGGNIALDEQIASNICVWRDPAHLHVAEEAVNQAGRKGRGRRRRFRQRTRGGA